MFKAKTKNDSQQQMTTTRLKASDLEHARTNCCRVKHFKGHLLPLLKMDSSGETAYYKNTLYKAKNI